MALAALVSRQKGNRFLRNLIEAELGSTRDIPYLKPGDYVRASSMYSLCAREEVLAAVLEVTRKEVVSPALELIFAHGRALHHELQNEILPRLGVLRGQWRCNWCMKLHGGLSPRKPMEVTLIRRPKACRRCQHADFTYNELMFEDKVLRINGHPDGFLQLCGLPGLGIVEGKSVGQKNGFEIRRTPILGHVIQAQTYMMLTGCRWAKILYWQKAESGLEAIVEHQVDYDPETVDAIREMVSSIWMGIQSKELPDRICETAQCKRASECQLVGPCFQSERSVKTGSSV